MFLPGIARPFALESPRQGANVNCHGRKGLLRKSDLRHQSVFPLTPKASRNEAQGCRAESAATLGSRREYRDNPVWVAEYVACSFRVSGHAQIQHAQPVAQPSSGLTGCCDPFPKLAVQLRAATFVAQSLRDGGENDQDGPLYGNGVSRMR